MSQTGAWAGRRMGKWAGNVPSSSEQFDLLSCSGERALQVAALLQKNGQVLFSLLPGKQRRTQGGRGFRALISGVSGRTAIFQSCLERLEVIILL